MEVFLNVQGSHFETACFSHM